MKKQENHVEHSHYFFKLTYKNVKIALYIKGINKKDDLLQK